MSIATNSIITYSDIAPIVLNSLKSVCCNIDSYSSNVPNRLRTGQGQVQVKDITTLPPSIDYYGGWIQQTFRFYANPSNLISIVTSSTVNSEWNTFLSTAGINSRSNKIIQTVDIGKIMGLFMQFMSYHVKPIYSRRQIYNTIESQALYQGCKYVTGTYTPTYTASSINPTSIPTINDSDITDVINKGFQANQLMTHCDNPNNHRCYLS